eukprot:3113064-Prymnesium_polylepis.1
MRGARRGVMFKAVGKGVQRSASTGESGIVRRRRSAGKSGKREAPESRASTRRQPESKESCRALDQKGQVRAPRHTHAPLDELLYHGVRMRVHRGLSAPLRGEAWTRMSEMRRHRGGTTAGGPMTRAGFGSFGASHLRGEAACGWAHQPEVARAKVADER